MRGRTNITQRALPYVNGDVITAEVESGNTISIGDFVEYKTASAISTADFLANGEIYYNHTSYMTNYILVLNYTNSSSLEIWDKRTTKLVTKITFENANYMSFDVLDDNKIILCAQGNSSKTTLAVYIIAFENNQLVIKDQKSFNIWVDFWNSTPSTASYVSCVLSGVCKLDDSSIVIMTNNASSDRQWWVTVIEYANEELGDIITSTMIQSGSSYGITSQINHLITNLSNKKIGFVIAGTKGFYGIIDFDNSYTPTLSQITEDQNFGTACTKSKINQGTICSIVSMYVGKILYYNATNDSFEIYLFQPKLSFNSQVYATNGNDNVVFISNVTNGGSGPNKYLDIIRVEFLENTKEIKVAKIELIKNYSFYNNYGMKIYFVNGENIRGYSMTNSNYYVGNAEYNMLYNSSDNELSTGVDTNYVKQYNGGKAIGFAKTAGNAGENIRIYVPHSS